MTEITREQVAKAAEEATNITQVARALGIREKKLSGRTSKRLRTRCPELDGILKKNRDASLNRSTESPGHGSGKLSPDDAEEPNPYRPGSMYNVLFREGSKKYWDKQALIAHVAELMDTEERLVSYQVPVLSNPRHSSNGNRSMALRDDKGCIRFTGCKKRRRQQQ